MSIEIVTVDNPISFAKELAIESELRGGITSEKDALHTVSLMEQSLCASTLSQGRHTIAAAEGYTLPYDDVEIEFMLDKQIVQSRVERPIATGKILGFAWFGSAAVSGFGVRLLGVDFLEPKRNHAETFFIPVLAIEVTLANQNLRINRSDL